MNKLLKFKLDHFLTVLIILTLITTPLYPLRLKLFGILPTTIIEILIGITSIIWLIDKARKRSFNLPVNKFKLIIGMFLITGILSVFTGGDVIRNIGRFRAFIAEPIIFYFIVIDTYVRYWSTRTESIRIFSRIRHFNYTRIIILSMIGSAIGISLLGILQFLFKIAIISPDQANRAHGFYQNANQLAGFLGPIILVYLAAYKNKLLKYPYNIFSIILLSAFIATNSQGGWLGLISGIIVILIDQIYKGKRLNQVMKSFFVSTSLLFIIFLTQISHFVPKVNNPWIRPGGTEQVRLCLWEGSFKVVSANPILGVGFANFANEYGSKYLTCDAEPFEDTHNIILDFWTKLGILGLASLLIILLLVFSQTQVFIYQLPFIYWFVHGLVDSTYFRNDLSLYWWVFLALINTTHIANHRPNHT